VITAGNFRSRCRPGTWCPPLLCGNAVVWKPAEYAAASARATRRAGWRAGVPAGVLNLVFADGPATYDGLEQALPRAWWTRSAHRVQRGGSADRRAVRPHLQSPCLELGGKNPMVVTPDAELDLAVEGALFSG